MAQDFESAVGKHLIYVHIGGGACSALDHVDGELVVELAGSHLDGCFLDGARLLVGYETELVVGAYGCDFGYGKTLDKQRVVIEMKFAYLEIFETAQGLHAVQRAFRHFACTEKVRFGAIAFFAILLHFYSFC